MPKMFDMIGKRFGRLTVLRELPTSPSSPERRYECRCQCGALTTVRGAALRKGLVKSCGCWRRDGYKEVWRCFDGTFDALSDFFASLVTERGWSLVEASASGGTMKLRYQSPLVSSTMEIAPFTLLKLSDDGMEIETKPANSLEYCRFCMDGEHRRDDFVNCPGPAGIGAKEEER